MNLKDYMVVGADNTCVPRRIDNYSKYMRNVKGSSKNTVDGYLHDLTIFLRFMKVRKGLVDDDIEFNDIDISDIDDEFYISLNLDDFHSFLTFCSTYLKNENITISRKVAALKSFFDYITVKEKVLPYNYTTELEKPKVGKRTAKHLNLEEANELLDNIKSRNPERDRLIITLFLNCGMRLSELCGIDISKIKGDRLTIIGKGNKERYAYLNEMSLDAIEKYLPIRNELLKKKGVKTDALFISERGNRIAKRTVQDVVENQLKNAHLDGKGYSTHKLRHTAATLLYKEGVDVLVLKEILGHEDISTTQLYTHTDSDMVRDAVKANPLNRRKKAE